MDTAENIRRLREERSNLARATALPWPLALWFFSVATKERPREPPVWLESRQFRPAYARRPIRRVESAKACAMPDLLCSLGTIRVRGLLDRRASSPFVTTSHRHLLLPLHLATYPPSSPYHPTSFLPSFLPSSFFPVSLSSSFFLLPLRPS